MAPRRRATAIRIIIIIIIFIIIIIIITINQSVLFRIVQRQRFPRYVIILQNIPWISEGG